LIGQVILLANTQVPIGHIVLLPPNIDILIVNKVVLCILLVDILRINEVVLQTIVIGHFIIMPNVLIWIGHLLSPLHPEATQVNREDD